MIRITAQNLSKNFNRRTVFGGISFQLTSPSSLAITGKNGSGKSTLSKIIAGVLSSSSGMLDYSCDGKSVPQKEIQHTLGFVSPYINLYDEFTAYENLSILSRIRSTSCDATYAKELLSLVNLWHRRDDVTATFSSGMKQRLKYVFALLHHPEILILDEPTSNLDAEGVQFVGQMIERQKRHGILIVATNDAHEAQWCSQEIHVGM